MRKKRKKLPSSENVTAETLSQEAAPETVQDKCAAIRAAIDGQGSAEQEEAQGSVADTQTKKNAPSGETKKKKKKKTSKKKSNKKNVRKSGKKKRKKNSLFPQQGDSVFEVLRKTVFLMSATVFMVCLALIGQYFWENYQNKLLNDEMSRIYVHRQPDNTGDKNKPILSGENMFYYLPGSTALSAINSDIVGFIEIRDIAGKEKPEIRYPVLQYRPDDHDDPGANGNDYYLDKNIHGEKEKAGSIFLDFRNYFDYVAGGKKDRDKDGGITAVYGQKYFNSGNLIIYGHNMHDYSMFGSLKRYINEADYYDNHPIVLLNSNLNEYKYKIFGMIIVDIDDETDTKFDYWNTLDFYEEEEFYNYVNEIKRRTVRLTDVDITFGDQILTLSTCNSTFNEGRLVVFARLLREGEDELEGCTSRPNPNIKWPNSYYNAWRKNTYDPNADFEPYG